jgi:ATP-dependent RNA helicase DDX41
VIGTPGRLSDMVNKKKINMDLCQYVVLDEADRMLDQVFELEIKNILEHFKVHSIRVYYKLRAPAKRCCSRRRCRRRSRNSLRVR